METIRQQFALELARALELAGYEARPAVLEREFNLRYHGEPVSYHAVRKWLHGETLPTVDKLQLLAQWLNISIASFIPAGNAHPAEEAEPVTYASSLSKTDQEVIQTYLCLPEEQRQAIARIVMLMATSK